MTQVTESDARLGCVGNEVLVCSFKSPQSGNTVQQRQQEQQHVNLDPSAI